MLIGTRRSLLGVRPVDDLYSKRIQEFSKNLVAHWALDDLAGAVAIDRSGNENHGDITGTTLGQPGIGDGLKSQYFDGANDYIDISAIASNLISNGGFETAGTGGTNVWDVWVETANDGVLANETSIVHTGTDAAKLTCGTPYTTKIETDISVIPGATYELKLYGKDDDATNNYITVYDLTNSGNIGSITGPESIFGTTYVEKTTGFTTPTSCVFVRIAIFAPVVTSKILYVDTISVRRTDIPTFDPHEGSMIVWVKVDGVGVWSDSATRDLIVLQADSNQFVIMRRHPTNNQVRFLFEANNVTKSYIYTYSANINWFPIGITWCLSGDEVKCYLAGDVVQTLTGLGVWTGILASNTVNIGAGSGSPANVHHGNLAHAQLYNKAHDADVMAYLMRRS